MKTSKIDKNKIFSLINEEAEVIKRKKELYEEVKKINEELKTLNERGLSGTFGFQGDNSEKSKTGFQGSQNISHISQLEDEMSAEAATKDEEGANVVSEDSDVESAKKENEALKKQMEAMKKAMEEFLKAGQNLNEENTTK